MKIDLSIVIPTYNEQGSVSELISSIIKESEKIILVILKLFL